MTTLVSKSTGTLNLLPVSGAGQPLSSYNVPASRMTLVDNTAADYPISSVQWNATNPGLLTFTCPLITEGADKTLTLKIDGIAQTTAPSPVIVRLVPPFAGNSLLAGAALAWDCSVPDMTTGVFHDYSGNGLDANTKVPGNYFYPDIPGSYLATVYTKTTQPSYPYTWTRKIQVSDSSPDDHLGTLSPTIVPTKINTIFSQGMPFKTIVSTNIVYGEATVTTAANRATLWTYSFQDSLGTTRKCRLSIKFAVASGTPPSNINSYVFETWSGTAWVAKSTAVMPVTLASASSSSWRLLMFVTRFNDDGSLNIGVMGQNQFAATIPNIWGVGINPCAGATSTILEFTGLSGDTAWVGNTSYWIGCAEIVGYTAPKPIEEIQINCAAWDINV